MSVEITFEKASATYLPGEIVKGTALLTLGKELQADSAHIVLKRITQTQWTETMVYRPVEDNPDLTVKHPYKGPRNCVSKGLVHNKKKKTFKAGRHRFHFSFTLPAGCPPSFKGEGGKITYMISLTIDKEWPFDTPNSKQFKVLPVFDLNTVAIASLPIHLEKHKDTGFSLLHKGNVAVRVTVPKSGFTPGEVIRMICDVRNNSSKPVIKAEAKLCRAIFYRTLHFGRRYACTAESVLLETTKDLSIAPKARSKMELELTVPRTMPTLSRDQCTNINIDYYLEIKFTTDNIFNPKIKLRSSVLIGTVPVVRDGSDVGVDDNDEMYAFVNEGYCITPPAILPSSSC